MLSGLDHFARQLGPTLGCLVVILFIAFVLARPVFADIHPVPLDKNTDSAKCLECHEDRPKGKRPHCDHDGLHIRHEVRVNRDATYVKLTKATVVPCASSHEDKDAKMIKGGS
jgi:hypothetical protein